MGQWELLGTVMTAHENTTALPRYIFCTFILTTNGGIGKVELLFAGFGVAAAENARIRLVLVMFLDLLLLIIPGFVVEPVALGTIRDDRHLVEFVRIRPELDVGITT